MSDELERGAFRWNRGGWLGTQLGGSCWILIVGVLTIAADPLVGGAALASFAGVNALGLALWRRRAQLAPYRAIQVLVVAEALAGLIVVVALDLRDAMRHLPEHSQVSPLLMYAALLVFPWILLQFHLQERAARRAATD